MQTLPSLSLHFFGKMNQSNILYSRHHESKPQLQETLDARAEMPKVRATQIQKVVEPKIGDLDSVKSALELLSQRDFAFSQQNAILQSEFVDLSKSSSVNNEKLKKLMAEIGKKKQEDSTPQKHLYIEKLTNLKVNAEFYALWHMFVGELAASAEASAQSVREEVSRLRKELVEEDEARVTSSNELFALRDEIAELRAESDSLINLNLSFPVEPIIDHFKAYSDGAFPKEIKCSPAPNLTGPRSTSLTSLFPLLKSPCPRPGFILSISTSSLPIASSANSGPPPNGPPKLSTNTIIAEKIIDEIDVLKKDSAVKSAFPQTKKITRGGLRARTRRANAALRIINETLRNSDDSC